MKSIKLDKTNMKKLLATLTLIAFAGSPALAFAGGQVQVYPTITNAHGGTKFAADIYTRIVAGSYTDQQTGVPTYEIPAGQYEVQFFPPAGYSYSAGADCTGIVNDGELKVCQVSYSDGASTAQTPPPAPQPAPTVETPTPSPSPTVNVPTDVVVSGVSSEEAAQIKALQEQILQLLLQLVDLLTKRLNQLQAQQ